MTIIFSSDIDNSIAGAKSTVSLHEENKAVPVEWDCIKDDLSNSLYVVTKVDGSKIELVPVDKYDSVKIKSGHEYPIGKLMNSRTNLEISVNHLIN